MAFRYQGPPSASSRDAQRKFFCELCQKGYAKQSDLVSHESDYDHQHRKREKDRKQLSKDLNADARAKSADKRDSGMKTISLASLKNNLSSGTKAPVFKPIGQAAPAAQTATTLMVEQTLKPLDSSSATLENDPSGAMRNGWYNDRYDPNTLTGCDTSCPVCQGKDDAICL